MKRVVVVADLHSGHGVGLTPPGWHLQGNGYTGKRSKLYAIGKEIWRWFDKKIEELQPIYLLVCNGDAIDGKGTKSSGTELITTDLEEQSKMAEIALLRAKAKHIVMTYGTGYHVSPTGEDWEDIIARNVNADKIGAHEWIEIDGVTMDFKHYIGSSQIPHGRHTAVARDRMQNLLWNEAQLQPKAGIVLRSHVHYYNHCGGPGWLAMTTPALQGMGSKFGSRKCSGIVDVGLISFDIENGSYSWQAHLAKLKRQRATALQL